MPALPPDDANSATPAVSNSATGGSADATAELTGGSSAQQPTPTGINWFRFWIQTLVAMMVFNVIAGLVTWYFIFPHLHPPK